MIASAELLKASSPMAPPTSAGLPSSPSDPLPLHRLPVELDALRNLPVPVEKLLRLEGRIQAHSHQVVDSLAKARVKPKPGRANAPRGQAYNSNNSHSTLDHHGAPLVAPDTAPTVLVFDADSASGAFTLVHVSSFLTHACAHARARQPQCSPACQRRQQSQGMCARGRGSNA